MIYRYLTVLALVFALAIGVFATETRVMTLGGVNHFVKDDYNIFIFPSTLNFYRSQALAEVKYGDLCRIGGHYSFGEGKGVVGVYIDTQGMMKYSYMPAQGGYDYVMESRLNFFYARPFGDTKFGMMLSLYGDSYMIEDNPNDATEESTSKIGLAAGLTMMEDKLDVAASFTMGGFTYVDTAGVDINEPDGDMNVDFKGRYWYVYNDEVKFIPYVDFGFWSRGYIVSATDDKASWSGTNINLGCGVNVKPDKHILLLFDLGFTLYNETTKVEPSGGTSAETAGGYLDLPYYRVGLEGYVTKWWTLRFGASKFWRGTSSESYFNATDIQVEKENDAVTCTFIGSGFCFGNLCIDAYFDPGFFNRGPNFISGYDADVTYWTSLKYCWGGGK